MMLSIFKAKLNSKLKISQLNVCKEAINHFLLAIKLINLLSLLFFAMLTIFLNLI